MVNIQYLSRFLLVQQPIQLSWYLFEVYYQVIAFAIILSMGIGGTKILCCYVCNLAIGYVLL